MHNKLLTFYLYKYLTGATGRYKAILQHMMIVFNLSVARHLSVIETLLSYDPKSHLSALYRLQTNISGASYLSKSKQTLLIVRRLS